MGEVIGEHIVLWHLLFPNFWAGKLVVWLFISGVKILSIESLVFGLNWGQVFMGVCVCVCVVIGNDIVFCGQDILCNFMEGLGMKEIKNLVDHYNQWLKEKRRTR